MSKTNKVFLAFSFLCLLSTTLNAQEVSPLVNLIEKTITENNLEVVLVSKKVETDFNPNGLERASYKWKFNGKDFSVEAVKMKNDAAARSYYIAGTMTQVLRKSYKLTDHGAALKDIVNEVEFRVNEIACQDRAGRVQRRDV